MIGTINAPYPETDCLAVLRCEVGHPPRFALVTNSPSAMGQVVGGPLDRICLPDGLCAVVNENAPVSQLSFNCRLYGWDIWGDFFICRERPGGYASVTADDMQHVLGWIAATPPPGGKG